MKPSREIHRFSSAARVGNAVHSIRRPAPTIESDSEGIRERPGCRYTAGSSVARSRPRNPHRGARGECGSPPASCVRRAIRALQPRIVGGMASSRRYIMAREPLAGRPSVQFNVHDEGPPVRSGQAPVNSSPQHCSPGAPRTRALSATVSWKRNKNGVSERDMSFGRSPSAISANIGAGRSGGGRDEDCIAGHQEWFDESFANERRPEQPAVPTAPDDSPGRARPVPNVLSSKRSLQPVFNNGKKIPTCADDFFPHFKPDEPDRRPGAQRS